MAFVMCIQWIQISGKRNRTAETTAKIQRAGNRVSKKIVSLGQEE